MKFVRGGLVIDGTGAPAYEADIVVDDGAIADVGRELSPPAGAEVLDATGLTVAPGFIDIHSHSDFTLLVDPRAVSQITQGVTLEVVGNCGFGCSPLGDPRLVREAIYGFREDVALEWNDMAGYLARLERARPAVNVAALVPNGQLRLATVGLAAREASADERAEMKRLLRRDLEQGGFGYSTGLEYATETGASEDEVADLCSVCGAHGGLYATHTRNRDEAASRRSTRPSAPPSAPAPGFRSRTSLRAAAAPTPSARSSTSTPRGRAAKTSPSTCTPGSSAPPISRSSCRRGRWTVMSMPSPAVFPTPTSEPR